MSMIATRVPLLALAATVGSISAVSLMLSRPEALIDRSVAAALAQVAPAKRVHQVATASPTEAELLQPSSTGPGPAGPFGLARSLAVGDRITISGADGERQTLEVSEVRALASADQSTSDGIQPRLMLVTCTVLGSKPGAVVRFVVEGTGLGTVRPSATLHRAL